jgi:hypothetical protein
VETFLSGVLDHVLVGADTGGFESLGAQLFILVGNQVHTERKVIDLGTFAAEIEDADLGIRYTTVEPGLRIRLRRLSSAKPVLFIYCLPKSCPIHRLRES